MKIKAPIFAVALLLGITGCVVMKSRQVPPAGKGDGTAILDGAEAPEGLV